MATDPDATSLAEIWASALSEYQREAKHPLDPTLLRRLRTVANPEDLLSQLEESDRTFRDFRSSRDGLWQKLGALVPPLAAALKIAITPASVSEAAGMPASAVLGALLHLVKSCQNVSEAYDWIEEVFAELQRFSDRLMVLMRRPMDALLKKQMVAILACILRVIGRTEHLIQTSRFRQYLRVAFLGKDEKTKQIIGDLEKLLANEHLVEVSLTLATVQKIDEKQDDTKSEIRKDIQKVRDGMRDERQEKKTEQARESVRRILCKQTVLEEVESTYHRTKRDMLQGTCTWLKDEPVFQSWVERRSRILWIFGGPGAGKSHLAAWIITQLSENLFASAYTRETSVVYFFVKSNNEHLCDVNNILKTLAWQLYAKDTAFQAHAVATSRENNPTYTPEDTWEKLFLPYYGSPNRRPMRATVVIDGLDEAPRETRQMLLKFLKGLDASLSQSPETMSIQFAVIGRNDLRNDMDFTKDDRTSLIKVDKTKNHHDIDNYVQRNLEQVEVLRRMRRAKPRGKQDANAAGAHIRRRILAGADGVFLWARLLIKTIINKDLAQIDEVLREPPRSLDDMIESVLQRIASDEDLGHDLMRRMLLYVVYAQRPLKFHELDLFLSLPNKKPNFLLWERIRGVLSAIFDLEFPQGKDPDEENEDGNVSAANKDADLSDSSSEGGFDFTGEPEEKINNDVAVTAPSAAPNRAPSWEVPLGQQKTQTKDRDHFNNGQLNTKVTFCHARFKGYVEREACSLKRSKLVYSIIPEFDRVHIDMTIMCLDVFRLEYSLNDKTRHLVGYPTGYLPFHLGSIDLKRISNQDLIQIVQGLHWLFGTERGATCFSMTYYLGSVFDIVVHIYLGSKWFKNTEPVRLVQSFLGEVALRGLHVGIDDAAQTWIQGASQSYSELLKAVILAGSKAWLKAPSFDDVKYSRRLDHWCQLIYRLVRLCENNKLPEVKWDSFMNFPKGEPPARVEHAACWAGLEKDTHWHTRLGLSFLQGGYFAEALAHFDVAMELSPEDAWPAMDGKARCYGGMEQFREAITWEKRALNMTPEKMQHARSTQFGRITNWSLRLGDHKTRLHAAWHEFSLRPNTLDAQVSYISALNRNSCWDRLIYIVKWLNERMKTGRWTYSSLVRLLWLRPEVYDYIGIACHRTAQQDLVLYFISQVKVQLVQGNAGKLALAESWHLLMAFYHNWYGCKNPSAIKPEQSCLGLLEPGPGDDVPYDLERFDRKTINKLARLYYDHAKSAWAEGRGAEAAAVFADKLQHLAANAPKKRSPSKLGRFVLGRKDYADLLWGRWSRETSNVGETSWRDCFRARLLEEMRSLDDDDSDDHTKDIKSMAVSLMHAGDRRNAGALLSIIFQPLEREETATKTNETTHKANEQAKIVFKSGDSGETNLTESHDSDNRNQWKREDPDFESPTPTPENMLPLNIKAKSWLYLCDECDRTPLEVDEWYFCEVCINIHWCGECLSKFRDPETVLGLHQSLCDLTHDMYRAWPIDPEVRDLAAIYVDGVAYLKKDWLEDLRAQWL